MYNELNIKYKVTRLQKHTYPHAVAEDYLHYEQSSAKDIYL